MSLYIPAGTVLLLALSYLTLCIVQKYKRRRRRVSSILFLEEKEEDKRTFISRTTTALITSVLLVYGGVLSSCLSLLFCVQVLTLSVCVVLTL